MRLEMSYLSNNSFSFIFASNISVVNLLKSELESYFTSVTDNLLLQFVFVTKPLISDILFSTS